MMSSTRLLILLFVSSGCFFVKVNSVAVNVEEVQSVKKQENVDKVVNVDNEEDPSEDEVISIEVDPLSDVEGEQDTLEEQQDEDEEEEEEEKTNYEGYRLLNIFPKTKKHLEKLHFLAKNEEDEFWTPIPDEILADNKRDQVDYLVCPENYEQVVEFLECGAVPFEIGVENLERLLEVENIPRQPEEGEDDVLTGRLGRCTEPHVSGFDFNSYHGMEDIDAYLDCITSMPQNRNKMTLIDIGQSYEGRRMRVVKIGTKKQRGRSIWIDGGIHAREWISPAAVLYIINTLLEEYNSNPAIREIVDDYDIYILPVHNPDGYEYSHTKNRMWRKTRSQGTRNKGCIGVDPNRNWSYRWGGKGSSHKPCSDTYRGKKAFSESETNNVQQFIHDLGAGNEFKLFLTYHSYGQYILYPWGYDRDLPEDWHVLDQLAKDAAQVVQGATGNAYKVGSAARALYPAAGGSDDWAKGPIKQGGRGGAGIPYSFTVELPDTGRRGFILPTSFIMSSANDAYKIAETMILKLKNLPG